MWEKCKNNGKKGEGLSIFITLNIFIECTLLVKLIKILKVMIIYFHFEMKVVKIY